MDDLGSFTPESQRAASDDVAEDLTQHLSHLADVLRSVDDDPRLMDASLEDVHEIAARLAKVVKRRVFNNPHLSTNAPYRDIFDIFEHARTNESDHYEVYADNLERHQWRQRKDLTVAESDSDKFAVVKRRRTYIATLFGLHLQISHIVDLLNA
jgi:hypothetical protein